MTNGESFTNIRSLISALAISMNLINPEMQHHHDQTAYLAFQIGHEMGLQEEELHNIVYAALLHDIGSVVSPQPEDLCTIEAHAKELSAIGVHMLKDLDDFKEIAEIIGIVQNSYQDNAALLSKSGGCSESSLNVASAIHLADVVTTLIDNRTPILNQVKPICSGLERLKGKEFSPEAMDAFLEISKKEFMWMDVALNPSFLLFFTGNIREISLDETLRLTRLMSRIIDYRSSFTAMHSAGVAASARMLAKHSGMTDYECKMMNVAGYLHDIGKLRVPNSILEKPGKLTEEEFNIMKEHPYYTRWILMNVDGFDKIKDWAGLHHEKLNGKGYPFHLCAEQLDTGSRIMAVADIFSAITEVRPYRDGMDREHAMQVLQGDAKNGLIDADLVALLDEHYTEINDIRESESREAGQRYFKSLELKKQA